MFPNPTTNQVVYSTMLQLKNEIAPGVENLTAGTIKFVYNICEPLALICQ